MFLVRKKKFMYLFEFKFSPVLLASRQVLSDSISGDCVYLCLDRICGNNELYVVKELMI